MELSHTMNLNRDVFLLGAQWKFIWCEPKRRENATACARNIFLLTEMRIAFHMYFVVFFFYFWIWQYSTLLNGYTHFAIIVRNNFLALIFDYLYIWIYNNRVMDGRWRYTVIFGLYVSCMSCRDMWIIVSWLLLSSSH